MRYFWIIIVLAVSFFFGAIGLPQIIGSLQSHQRNWYITILLWVIILIGMFLATVSVLPWCKIAYLIGTCAALLTTLSAGKIQ